MSLREPTTQRAIWGYHGTLHLQSKQRGRNYGHNSTETQCTHCYGQQCSLENGPHQQCDSWFVYRSNMPNHLRSPSLQLFLSGTCLLLNKVYVSTTLKTVEMLFFKACCRYLLLQSLQFLVPEAFLFFEITTTTKKKPPQNQTKQKTNPQNTSNKSPNKTTKQALSSFNCRLFLLRV